MKCLYRGGEFGIFLSPEGTKYELGEGKGVGENKDMKHVKNHVSVFFVRKVVKKIPCISKDGGGDDY